MSQRFGISSKVKKVLNNKNLILSKYPDSRAKDLKNRNFKKI